MTILAAKMWPNNRAMMADVAQLYIRPADVVLDPTFGKGGFWPKQLPLQLITHDLFTVDGVDFRHLPEPDGSVDVVTFDPAYVTPGGRATSTIGQMNQAYGMNTAKRTLDEQWYEVIVPGIRECIRVLKPGGLIMVKTMCYISSGRYHNYRQKVLAVLDYEGLTQVDEFSLVRKTGGPQPKDRTRKCDGPCKGTGFIGPRDREDPCLRCNHTGRIATIQQHSRNNVSFLIVARKATR